MNNRKSIRIPNFDYSSPGSYFITICTHQMHEIFGKIVDEKMIMNEMGETAKKYWIDIPIHYPHMELDEFVIMPNHVHGIINIIDDITVWSQDPVTRINRFQQIIPRSICTAIRGYKLGVTKWARNNTSHYTVWQRNYFEHIINNDDELDRIRDYIQYNPLNWQLKKVEGPNIWE